MSKKMRTHISRSAVRATKVARHRLNRRRHQKDELTKVDGGGRPFQKGKMVVVKGKAASTKPKGKFEILPPLREYEYQTLKDSIRHERRIHTPIMKDKYGNTIDGHHREQIIAELKEEGIRIVPLIEVVKLESEEEVRHLALTLNLARRHLTTEQKRIVVANELRKAADMANDWVGDICGVDGKTVKSVRKELELTSEILTVKKFRRRDGRTTPATKVAVRSNGMATKVGEWIRALGPKIPEKSQLRANYIRKLFEEQEHEKKIEATTPVTLDDIKIHQCDFRKLRIDRPIDSVITDPPWSIQFENVWVEIGKFAAEVLKQDGLLASYSPSLCMDSFVASLRNDSLKYVRPMQVLFPHPVLCRYGRVAVMQNWRPIHVYAKGSFKVTKFNDLIRGTGREKTHHPWQQSLSEAVQLVRMLTRPGDLVFDPCGGSFTVAVACAITKRRFIGCEIEKKYVKAGHYRLAHLDEEIAAMKAAEEKLGLKLTSE